MNKQLSVLNREVTLKMFTQEIECQFFRETRILLEELTETSHKIKLEILNFVIDKDKADAIQID